MNRANIKKVRDHIAKVRARHFSMYAYFGEWMKEDEGDEFVSSIFVNDGTNAKLAEGSCNTCACIAGFTLAVLEPGEKVPGNIPDRARKLLGLDYATASSLFEPNNNDQWFADNMRLREVTRPHAVRALDHLLATGEVDWESTRWAKRDGDHKSPAPDSSGTSQ